MYLALDVYVSDVHFQETDCISVPFGGISLLLHLSKYTFRLIINTVCTSWQLSIAFDFLLPAHIASLSQDYISDGVPLTCDSGHTRAILLRLASLLSSINDEGSPNSCPDRSRPALIGNPSEVNPPKI
jgi:hypothetical protein